MPEQTEWSPASLRELAKITGCNRSRIQRVIEKYAMQPAERKGRGHYYVPADVIQALVRDVEERAQAKMPQLDEDGKPAFQKPDHPDYERWRETKEKADARAMDNAIRRGELVELEAIFDKDRLMLATVAQMFDALGVAVKREMPDIDDTVLEKIMNVVARSRNYIGTIFEEKLAEFLEGLDEADTMDEGAKEGAAAGVSQVRETMTDTGIVRFAAV